MKQLDVNNVFQYRNLNKTIYMHIYIYVYIYIYGATIWILRTLNFLHMFVYSNNLFMASINLHGHGLNNQLKHYFSLAFIVVGQMLLYLFPKPEFLWKITSISSLFKHYKITASVAKIPFPFINQPSHNYSANIFRNIPSQSAYFRQSTNVY